MNTFYFLKITVLILSLIFIVSHPECIAQKSKTCTNGNNTGLRQFYINQYRKSIKIDCDKYNIKDSSLFDKKYDINAYACYCGDSVLISDFLKKNHKLPIKSYSDGLTLPMLVAIGKEPKLLFNIIEYIGKDNNTTKFGDNLLDIAVQIYTDTCIISRLIRYGQDVFHKNNSRLDAIEIAYDCNNTEVFEYLYDLLDFHSSDPYLQKSKLFELGLISSDTALVRKIANHVNKTSGIACCIDRYLTQLYDHNYRYTTFNKYRENLVDTTTDLYLTRDLDFSMFNILFSNGLDINYINEKGETIIFSYLNNFDIIKYLISSGININHVNPKRQTFLDFYIENRITDPFCIYDIPETYDEQVIYFDSIIQKIKYLTDAGAKSNDKPDVLTYLQNYGRKNNLKSLDLVTSKEIKQRRIKK